jgi:mRNA interferase HicA
VKYSEFRRWLESRGVVIEPGKGSHHKASLSGKETILPYHGSKEIGKGLMEKIKKDLKLK